ncbi:MAG: twin-arginine translocase subunit TatB [Clostridia bacterium]|nr:twin-arginine translocase subunit TatB [Clostridia bacterium]
MFNLGMMELVLVLAVAFVVVGPKDLPKVARWIARQFKNTKKLWRQVKDAIGWDELTKEIQETTDTIQSVAKDADISGEIQKSADDLRTVYEDVQENVAQASKDIQDELKV